MREEAGDAFDHYVRTDRSGARPVPSDLLDTWISRGWVTAEEAPSFEPYSPVPCLVLDPFNGAGTAGVVAQHLGRKYVGIELSVKYLQMSVARLKQPSFHLEI